MADMSKIPLVALSIDTKILVSTLLNPTKWLPTDDGLPRDWRGLAHLCNLESETLPSLQSHADPTGRIITIMENKTSCPTLMEFQSILGKIDRWDIVDDATSFFERDAEKYLERMERCSTSAEEIEADSDKQVLTIDDLYRFRQGLDKQCYDAFLLHSEEDMDFVTEMIDNLEKKHNLKLCIKDRDLIGGVTFEHEAVMQLISERCNRLIVVVSPSFLKSSANKFFLNYAQAVGIEMRQRKVIPCLYKKCELPPQLRYTFILDYSKGALYDFWGRLGKSINVIAVENSSNSNLPTQQSSQRCNNEKSVVVKEEGNLKTSTIDAACTVRNDDPRKETNEVSSAHGTPKKLVKPTKTKVSLWSKRKREKNPKGMESVTETISISLPSLDDLPPLDIMESTSSSNKPTKRKKNLVGTCVKKVQSLLSKS